MIVIRNSESTGTKGKFPMILEQEVELFNARQRAEKKRRFEQNSQIVLQQDDVIENGMLENNQ